jgi:hypothetical protein
VIRETLVLMAAFENSPKEGRDLMAPDTEPTDEELAVVMRAARDLAIQRRAISDAWIAARLEEATRIAREQRALYEQKDRGS